MAQVTESIEEQLREIYSEKVTVNLDSKSSMTPDEFWSSMELIAINNKEMLNFHVK